MTKSRVPLSSVRPKCRYVPDETALLLMLGCAADCTPEDVNMTFMVSAFKEAGNQVAFGRNLCFTDRADPLQFVGIVGVTMRTAEDMAYPVVLTGI